MPSACSASTSTGRHRHSIARRVRDSTAVTRYLVDPARSTVSAVVRPVLGDDTGPPVTAVSGTIDVDGDRPSGTITVTFDGRGSNRTALDLDLEDTQAELTTDTDGMLVLHGRTSRPAGVLGLTGPPMLNLTVLMRWRLVLVPA